MPSLSTALYAVSLLGCVVDIASAYTLAYCSSQNTGAAEARGNCTGYAYSVLQYQSCWCSDYAPAEQDSILSCTQTCPGFPDNNCGNLDPSLFAYLVLGPSPSGTLGAHTSSSKPQSSPVKTTSSSPQPSSQTHPTTHSQVSITIIHTTTILSKSTVTASRQSSVNTSPTPSVTSILVTTVTASPQSSSSPESSTSSIATSSTSTTTHASRHISTEVTTKSNVVVTTTLTTTPNPSTNPLGASHNGQSSHKSLSGGDIAGIVIGVVAGVALLAAIGFFLVARRRQSDEDDDAVSGAAGAEPGAKKKKPRRNTSVLSRTGLLSRGRQSMIETNNYEDPSSGVGGTTLNSVRQSMMFGAGAIGSSVDPSSPIGSSHDAGSTRRPSKPLVYDQRLNPSALFASHDNGSRVSMQDNNDYSRPLGIANPDPRPSTDSRRSNWD